MWGGHLVRPGRVRHPSHKSFLCTILVMSVHYYQPFIVSSVFVGIYT
ncbi:hypothetical protein FDUTEX481_08068 [Tolypothrix sp. PCC 7601]|nr:hypothetical protein FDUTEX481_08068 [Tolypothrix sp. PCC 7601]